MKLGRLCVTVLLWTLCVVLSGCVNLDLPKQDNVKYTKQPHWVRAVKLAKIHYWNVSGAFSVKRTVKEPGQKPRIKTSMANYDWQQISRHIYTISIDSALDVYSMSIDGRPGRVEVNLPSKKIVAKNPERVLQKEFGWSLPIRNLYFWVRGLAAPGIGKPSYDKYGHLVGLQQQGWTISFAKYKTIKKVDLPQLITMIRPGLQIKVAIKQWNINV